MKADYRKAFQDITGGLALWRVFLLLAWQDIQLRYRRSLIGPFWLTISMAVTVYSMGFVYAQLFKVNIVSYYPHLAAGMICWGLLASLITESSEAFIGSQAFIKQIKLPYTIYLHRVIVRNMIILGHNLIVMVPILIFFHQTASFNLNDLLLIPNLFIIYLIAYFYSIIFAMIGTRFCDVTQIIRSLVQVFFFVTPVMWLPSSLPPKMIFLLLSLNPFYSLLEILRQPMLGGVPSMGNYIVCGFLLLVGIGAVSYLFSRYRARIIYWM